jgi:transposase
MQVYIGIDWSSAKQDISFVNENGAMITKRTIAHCLDGFEQLDQERQKLGVQPEECVVGMETAYSLLIDFLWDRHYSQIYVLPSARIKNERPKLHASGAYNDQGDAFLIASLLRVERNAFFPWHPDGMLVQQMRSLVSLVLHLTTQIIRTSNRLTSVLKRYYPAALQVFSGLDTLITQTFIQSYPTPQEAAQLSWEMFEAFAQQHGHRQPRKLPACYARLQQAQPHSSEAVTAACAREAVILSTLLEQHMRSKRELVKELYDLFQQHPDQAIFASLPGTGEWLAPALLAKIGDDRNRFPQADYLQGLAGTCPVTKESGKHRQVVFRHACDHEFRQVVQQWSRASVIQSGWAAAYFEQALQRCGSENQAYRCLGNRWIKILWKIWQSHQEYDENYHMKQIALRKRPKSAK